VRGIATTAHYMGVGNQDTSFAGEAAAIRLSAGVSMTDAICRVPRLSRAFTEETELLRQRLMRLEAAGDRSGLRVGVRMIRWFWCVVFAASAAAFAAGYVVSASG
jgi:hypothetical protein